MKKGSIYKFINKDFKADKLGFNQGHAAATLAAEDYLEPKLTAPDTNGSTAAYADGDVTIGGVSYTAAGPVSANSVFELLVDGVVVALDAAVPIETLDADDLVFTPTETLTAATYALTVRIRSGTVHGPSSAAVELVVS